MVPPWMVVNQARRLSLSSMMVEPVTDAFRCSSMMVEPVKDAFPCFLISKASLRREDLDMRFLLPEGRPALALRVRAVFVG